MPSAKSVTTDQQYAILSTLITETLKATRESSAELKSEFNVKHQENMEARHDLRDKVDELGNRVSLAEATLRTIVGDNTGESGLLHDMKRGQDALKDNLTAARDEFRNGVAGLTADLREIKNTASSAPQTRDWMNKWLGVGAFIAAAASVVGIIAGIITLLRYVESIAQHLPR